MILSKLHGLGNDFLVLLDERQAAPVHVGPELAAALCDRHRGIGADGLLQGSPAEGDASGVDVVMVLRNADGGRAEMSGNGIRCLAHAVARARMMDAGVLRIATDGGVRTVTLEAGATGAHAIAAVDMGQVADGPEIPAGLELPGRAATADVGNPHLVIEVDDPWAVPLATEGPRIEAAFPTGINVEFVASDGNGGLLLAVWERGAGITRACGSGATAAVAVARRWGIVGDATSVRMPGGVAEVELADRCTLRGPSVHIAEIEVDDAIAVDVG